MKAKKGSKYAGELERLRELNAIKEVLKKSDIENAALTNTSKDSETVSDNVVDNMLNQLDIDKNAHKDLEIIESLTAQNARRNLINDIRNKQAKAAIASKKASKPKRKLFKLKHKKATPKNTKKSKGKKKR